MSWLKFLRRKRSDTELQDEIETFLTEETADNEARGMSPGEARRQARIKFGNAQRVRHNSSCAQDFKFGQECRIYAHEKGLALLHSTVLSPAAGRAAGYCNSNNSPGTTMGGAGQTSRNARIKKLRDFAAHPDRCRSAD
jgi:hypothetical protein